MPASTATWMLFSLLIGAVVTAAALAAHDAQRAALRGVRFAWFGALIAIVGLSVIAPLRRTSAPLRIAMPTLTTTAATPVTNAPAASWFSMMTHSMSRTLDSAVRPIEAALQVARTQLDRWPTPVHITLASLWLLASFVTITVFVVSYLRVRRVMRRWPVQQIDETAARIAPTAGPAVMGLAPSQIVLPAWLLSRPIEEQRVVIAHEREHVSAGDPWLLVIGCVMVALMPWNPALWYALNRLRLAIEVDCDQRVLRHGVAAATYGSLLIDLSATRTAFPSAMPAFSMPAFTGSGSYLERRLVAMTSRPSRFAASRRIVGVAIAAAALITACESKLPTSAELDKMNVADAQTRISKVTLDDQSKSKYFVDGTEVGGDVAKKLAAEKIATINVRRAAAGDTSVVMINTFGGKGYVTIKTDTNPERRKRSAEAGAAGFTTPYHITRDSIPAPREENMKRKFDGLLIIDGKIAPSSALEALLPNDIDNIEVMKGAAASAAYSDPRAANGVIKVTLKVKK